MVKKIAYKLRFVDSFRFMSTSLSKLFDNMPWTFNNIECKSCLENIKIDSECYLVGLKNDRLIYKCKECKKRMEKINKWINRKLSECISIL